MHTHPPFSDWDKVLYKVGQGCLWTTYPTHSLSSFHYFVISLGRQGSIVTLKQTFRFTNQKLQLALALQKQGLKELASEASATTAARPSLQRALSLWEKRVA